MTLIIFVSRADLSGVTTDDDRPPPHGTALVHVETDQLGVCGWQEKQVVKVKGETMSLKDPSLRCPGSVR